MFADFHNDILTATGGDLPTEYIDNNIITAVFRGNRSFKRAFSIAAKARFLAYEDAGYEDLDYDLFFKRKPIYVGLTWNGENRFGYGCNFEKGLKKEGLDFIELLNSEKIAIDCAHISKGGFKDVIEKAEIVVDSHTCFSEVFEHKRNLDKWQLNELVKRNALIGVTCCGYFMTDKKHCKISDFIRQIDYFVQNFGVDNLAIGTDFYGCDFLAGNILGYDDLSASVRKGLKRLGYDHNSVDKILYNNLLLFTEKIKNKQNGFDSENHL